MTNKDKYFDLIISQADSSKPFTKATHFRKCDLQSRGNQHYIKMQLPVHVQEMIVSAYEAGKEVRIFA